MIFVINIIDKYLEDIKNESIRKKTQRSKFAKHSQFTNKDL